MFMILARPLLTMGFYSIFFVHVKHPLNLYEQIKEQDVSCSMNITLTKDFIAIQTFGIYAPFVTITDFLPFHFQFIPASINNLIFSYEMEGQVKLQPFLVDFYPCFTHMYFKETIPKMCPSTIHIIFLFRIHQLSHFLYLLPHPFYPLVGWVGCIVNVVMVFQTFLAPFFVFVPNGNSFSNFDTCSCLYFYVCVLCRLPRVNNIN